MMKRKVAIVALAQSKYEVNKKTLSLGEMIWEVVEKILRETGLTFEAQAGDKPRTVIDKIVSCSEDYWQGRTISDCFYHLEMGALGMSVTKVAGDGASAVYHGAVNILSGKELVPEFMPYFSSIEPIVKSIEQLLEDTDKLTKLNDELIKLAEPLARKNASEQVKEIVVEMLR